MAQIAFDEIFNLGGHAVLGLSVWQRCMRNGSRITWSVLPHLHHFFFTPLVFDVTAWLRRIMVAKENNGSNVFTLEESFYVVARWLG